MITPLAKKKAIMAVIGFCVFAIVPFFFDVQTMNWSVVIPLEIFYMVLLCHTYYAALLFSSLIPRENRLQSCIDALFVLIYFALANSIRFPVAYAIILAILFTLGTLKYSNALYTTGYPKLFKRKITIDTLGILLSIIVLVGFLLNLTVASAWFLTIVFAIAGFILFFIYPLYSIKADQEIKSDI
jgi:hypothetical protein